MNNTLLCAATILISGSKSAAIDLIVKGDLNRFHQNLADARFDFEVGMARDMAVQIVASEGLQPMFRMAHTTGDRSLGFTSMRGYKLTKSEEKTSRTKPISA